MDKAEFWHCYKQLHEAFPSKFMTDNPGKLNSMFEYISPLPVSFMQSFVKRAIKANDPDLDLMKAAAGEFRAMREAERTKALITKHDEHFSNDGLEKALKELGVNSLLEAVIRK